MKKFINTIVILVLFSLIVALLSGCTESDGDVLRESEEEFMDSSSFIIDGSQFSTIEELENRLMFSRLMKMGAFECSGDGRIEELQRLCDIRVNDVFELVNLFAEFYNYFTPTLQFDGFELLEIGVGESTINYIATRLYKSEKVC